MSLTEIASPEKIEIRRIFDSIAYRYDFLNSLLSFRMDFLWRRRALRLVLEGHEKKILDLGTGTGKFLEIFLKAQTWERAVALDFSRAMLERARKALPGSVETVNADFHDLPFQPESFDLIVSAFTLRSVKDMPLFLGQVARILTPGGKAAFLCLTRPTNSLWKILYDPYLKFYLPFVGRFFSGNPKAYRFLESSIQTFQSSEVTAAMMRQAGFARTDIHRFTFGTATLILGRK